MIIYQKPTNRNNLLNFDVFLRHQTILIVRFFSNFSTKPQFLYEGAIFLKKFNIKN